MTDYEFVTREELDKFTELSTGAAAIKFQFAAYRLLAERDAYREVARLYGHVCHTKDCKCGEDVDAEAARIVEGK